MRCKISVIFIFSLIILPVLFTGCGDNDIEIKEAPIHEISIAIAESYPVQIMLYIKGGLSDGCTTFHDIETGVSGDTVEVIVTVQRPKDEYCTAIYTYFEKNINLGSDFISGKTYTVKVNDKITEFTMP